MSKAISTPNRRRVVGALAAGLMALSLAGSAEAQQQGGGYIVSGPPNLGGCLIGLPAGHMTVNGNQVAVCYVVD